MSQENEQPKRSKKILIFKILFYGLLVTLPFYYILKYMFAIHLLDPSYYGNYFYLWRKGGGDTVMINGRYKPVKINLLKKEGNTEEYFKRVQEEPDFFLVRANYPDHFPRDSEHNHTVVDDFYYEYLKLRDNYIRKCIPDEYKGNFDLKDSKTLCDFFKNGSKDYILYFTPIKDEDMKDLMKGVSGRIKKALIPFSDLISSMVKKEVKFDGEKADEKLMEKCKKILKELDYEDITEDQINDFFLSLGRVDTTPWQSRVYSYGYYFYIWLTGNYDFKATEEKEKEGRERMKVAADVYAQTVGGVFENGIDYQGGEGFMNIMRKVFGPKRNESGFKEKEEEKKAAAEVLEKNIKEIAV